jgi:hypothetical protein
VYANQFVLSSGNYSSGNGLVGAVPNWLLTAIQQELTTGDGNIMSVLSSMNNALNTLQLGITQSIASLNTTSLSQSSLLTGLRSDVDGNNASILNVLATKVDTASATAIAANAIQSTFGTDAHAFVGNIASTYVDANSAIAQDMNLLTTTLNGVNASVSDISTLTVESVPNPLWVDNGNQLDPDINGNLRYVTQAKSKKQLAVDANGVITSLLLDSGSTSAITMQADQFKLVASGQSAISQNPFTVNATNGEITLNGKVSFNSVTDVPQLGSTPQQVIDAVNGGQTTTINGSKITTGSISSNNLSTNIALIGGSAYSSGFPYPSGPISGTPSGFRLSSTAAGNSSDPTIYGAYIKGGTIDGGKFIGALQSMNIFNNSSTAAPSQDTNNPNVVASFTMPAPIAGISHRLYINIFCFSNSYGGWVGSVDVRVNGISISGNSAYVISRSTYNSSPFGQSYITNYSYNSSSTIEVYSSQHTTSVGGDAISSLNVNISALGVI